MSITKQNKRLLTFPVHFLRKADIYHLKLWNVVAEIALPVFEFNAEVKVPDTVFTIVASASNVGARK